MTTATPAPAPAPADEITYTTRTFDNGDIGDSVKAAIDKALASPGLSNPKVTSVHFQEANYMWGNEDSTPEIIVTVKGS